MKVRQVCLRSTGMRTRRLLTAGTAATLLVAAAATELALPSMAENRLRDELASVGSVTSVDVSTSPGLELLFGSMDRATVEMSSASLHENGLGEDMLTKAEGVAVLEAQIDVLHAGPIDVEAVQLDKKGDSLAVTGRLDVDAAESFMPGAELQVDEGRMIVDLSGLSLPLPLPGPLQLEIVAEDGKLVARPLGAAAALLPAQPLLDRPELSMTALRGDIAGGQVHVTARATINDV